MKFSLNNKEAKLQFKFVWGTQIVLRRAKIPFLSWVKKAQKYNLNGWVMNCDDKSVEFIISGEKNNIDKFVKECYEGPTFSNVKNIELKKLPFLDFKNFEIKYL